MAKLLLLIALFIYSPCAADNIQVHPEGITAEVFRRGHLGDFFAFVDLPDKYGEAVGRAWIVQGVYISTMVEAAPSHFTFLYGASADLPFGLVGAYVRDEGEDIGYQITTVFSLGWRNVGVWGFCDVWDVGEGIEAYSEPHLTYRIWRNMDVGVEWRLRRGSHPQTLYMAQWTF